MKKNLRLVATSPQRYRLALGLTLAALGGSLGLADAASLTWTGAASSAWDTTTLNWKLADNTATNYTDGSPVLFDDTGLPTVTFDQTVSPGGITVNNTVDYTLSGLGALSGSGGLVKQGTGKLILSNTGSNDFTGSVTVSAGSLQVGNSYSLGSTNAGTVVANGAQLEIIDNSVMLAEPITLSGSGPDGSGAFVNNSGQTASNSGYKNLNQVTLAGDTTLGGNGRLNLGWNGSDPSVSRLNTGGQPYKLIYAPSSAGAAFIIGSVTVDPALGDVEVHGGYFNLQNALPALGNPAYTLRVWPGAQVYFYQLANQLNKNLALGSDGSTPSLQVGGNSVARLGGTVLLTNDCIFYVNSGSELDLNGGLGGGNLLQNTPGRLVLNGSSTNAGTTASAGTLTLNGTHTGPITVLAAATFNGTGTNYGTSDVSGALLPGGTNQAGTLTLNGLTLEYGATLSFDLGAANTVGAGVNDLIQVNGDLTINANAVTINPQGYLLTGATHPYRLFNYTGNLTVNGPLTATGPNGYTFTVDTSTQGQVNLVVSGGPLVWNGGSATDSNWSDAANWSGSTIASGSPLVFGGTTRLNNTNDTTADTAYGDITFLSGAGAFVLGGNSVALGGNLVNSSANRQTLTLGLSFGLGTTNSYTLDGGSAGLVLGGVLNSTQPSPGYTKLTLAGQGTVTNLFANVNNPGGTNTFYFPTNSNWTLEDNATHTMTTVPWGFAVDGTFNFGSAATAPYVNTTAANLLGVSGASYNSVGTVSRSTGTLNVRNGNLMLAANRLYTAVTAYSTGIVNVAGGTLNVRGGFFGASGNGTNEMSILNVSSGFLNLGPTNNSTVQSLYLALAGNGTLNMSGGSISAVTLDISSNQRGNTMGSVGTVNLNGGTIIVNSVTTASSSPQTGLANGTAATFYFNGGTLKTRGTTPTTFQGHTASPALPITAYVKAGGAILDTANYGMVVLESLLHDPALGTTPDGGLTKLGTGPLTLALPCTYTGPTYVSKGTLILSNSASIASSSVLNLASGTVLNVTNLPGFTLASGQTLTGQGSVTGAVVVASGATLAPGYTNGTLSFSNSLTLNAGSTSVLSLNRGVNPSNTMAQVAAPLTYGGTLVITNLGAALQPGDTFKLFNAPSYAGTFSQIVYPSGYNWTNTLTTDGSVKVLSLSVPSSPTNVTYNLSANNLTISWPANYQGWILQSQTNAPGHGLGTNWTDVPNSAGVTSMSFVVDPANGAVFFRLRYP